MTTTEEAVNQGATHMADAEDALQAAVEALNSMPAVFAALREQGVVGYLESQRLASEAQSLAGQVAGARASVFMYHEDLTARSVELDLEQYLPQPRSGGGGR
jgi:hypothetical protein